MRARAKQSLPVIGFFLMSDKIVRYFKLFNLIVSRAYFSKKKYFLKKTLEIFEKNNIFAKKIVMLYQLIYVSKRKCSEEEIIKILEKSREKNKDINVTGMLLYTKDSFIQCIEGEKDEVTTLYEKIKKDERHSNSILISYKFIKKRDFPSWNMGEKKINIENTDFMVDMSDAEKTILSSILSGKEETNAIEVIRKLASIA